MIILISYLKLNKYLKERPTSALNSLNRVDIPNYPSIKQPTRKSKQMI